MRHKNLHAQSIESNGQGHNKNQSTMPQGAININTLSTKTLKRDSPSYWCPTDLSNVLRMTYLQSQKEVHKGQE